MNQKNTALPKALFWFRRDLRLFDNVGLAAALKEFGSVLPIFIFDETILRKLRPDDARVLFIYQTIEAMKKSLREMGSDLLVLYGDPRELFPKIFAKWKPEALYFNHDSEPQATERDNAVKMIGHACNVVVQSFKDQVIFEKDEILSNTGSIYTVYTPYKKKWLATFTESHIIDHKLKLKNFWRGRVDDLLPLKKYGGFTIESFAYFPKPKVPLKLIREYHATRNIPALQGTTRFGVHLRFGTVSVRELIRQYREVNAVFLSELIWREFFMQILFHFPHVVDHSFRPRYDHVAWRKSKTEFERWSNGQTGYPLVDAGIRELNQTGFMHNRVRMVVASFFCKHLLHYWYEGERYMADRLLDYELSSNNGNWQWAAGTGCDAAPYFRVFHPELQAKKFDPGFAYIRKWVPEFETSRYPRPMIEHVDARARALDAYRKALKT